MDKYYICITRTAGILIITLWRYLEYCKFKMCSYEESNMTYEAAFVTAQNNAFYGLGTMENNWKQVWTTIYILLETTVLIMWLA